MITADQLLQRPGPAQARDATGTRARKVLLNSKPQSGIRARVEQALTDEPRSATSIAKQLGADPRRIGTELSHLLQQGRAVRDSHGTYRKARDER